MTDIIQRRRRRTRRLPQQGPLSLHIVTFRLDGHRQFPRWTTVVVRGRMTQNAAMTLAQKEAARKGGEPWLTDVLSVPAPRPTPALDAICQTHTAFPSFVALLTATAGYVPSLRLDIMSQDGVRLAKAYDRMQQRWGTKRRAFVTGEPPKRSRPPHANLGPDESSRPGTSKSQRRPFLPVGFSKGSH